MLGYNSRNSLTNIYLDMKKNLYLLSCGILLCSCSEPTDVVTGHARIILSNSAPVVTPVAASPLSLAPAPQQKVEEPAPAATAETVVEPQVEEKAQPSKNSLFAQNQPKVEQPASPVETAVVQAPTPEIKTEISVPAAPEIKPVAETAAPAAEEAVKTTEELVVKSTPVSQNQPVVSAPASAEIKKPEVTLPEPRIVKPAVSQNQPVVTSPAPIATEKPQVTTSAPITVKPKVSQNQPATTAPRGVNYRNSATGQPVKRKYPIMPGQNRGLRNR